MDQVEDEHLVQVQDHPVQMLSVKVEFAFQPLRLWSHGQENLPWQTADEESGDDGDEDQGEPLLSTSSSSTLPHLRKHQLAYISIPFPDSFCDPL